MTEASQICGASFLGKFVKKMLCEKQNVVVAFTQRGCCYVQHIESITQVFPKTPFGYRFFQVHMGCCDYPDISRNTLGRTDAA